MAALTFADLAVGATFDFVSAPGQGLFFARCTKVGPRSYSYVNAGPTAVKSGGKGYGIAHNVVLRVRIGSIRAFVYNVRCPFCDRPNDGRLARDRFGRLSCALCANI